MIKRLLPFLLLACSPALAAFHMVTPTGSGTNSGADWNNAMVGNTILNGGTLVRGDVYCIGGGTYNNWVLSQAASGTTVIEIRAAVPSDAGCGNVIAGWSATVDTTQNPAVITKGALTANTFAFMVNISSPYWLINGVQRASRKTGYTIQANDLWPNYIEVIFATAQNNVTIQYVEMIGGGIHEDSTETTNITSTSGTGSVATVTITPNCAAGQRCTMPWFTNQYVTIAGNGAYNCTACQITSVSGNTFTYASAATGNVTTGTVAGVANADELVRVIGTSGAHVQNFTLAFCYIHNPVNSPVQMQYADGAVFHDNVFGANAGTPADHSNDISMDAMTNLSIYRNVFEDCESTACIASGVNHLTDSNVVVYDNLAYTHSGNPYHQSGVGNGFYSVTTTTGQSGLHLYNNSVGAIAGTITQQNGLLSNTSVTATSCTIQNNLVWGNGTAVTGTTAQGCTEDHNTALFIGTNTLFVAASDVVSTNNTAGNPFTNWTGTCSGPGGVIPTCSGENYNLVSAGTGNWDARLSLGAPYDTDFANVAFTSSRGAYQFASATPQVGLSPTSISFGNIVVNTTSGNQTITLCNGSWAGAVCNAAGASLTITSITLTGTNAAQFAIATNNCGASLAAGSTCTVLVNFTPNAVASFSANLTYTTNAASSPDNAPLSGSGVAAPGANGIATPGIPFGFTAVPLPLPPTQPTILSISPAQSYVTAQGCSQDGVKWANPCVITLSCSGCGSSTQVTFAKTAVPATYNTGKLVASVPLSLIPVPTAPTTYQLALANPVMMPVLQ